VGTVMQKPIRARSETWKIRDIRKRTRRDRDGSQQLLLHRRYGALIARQVENAIVNKQRYRFNTYIGPLPTNDVMFMVPREGWGR
jgi:hypothetical protein